MIEEQERKVRLGKMLMKGHYPYFTLVLTKALTSLDMLTSVWLSHAHLLLQLGRKAGADGGANGVPSASISITTLGQ